MIVRPDGSVVMKQSRTTSVTVGIAEAVLLIKCIELLLRTFRFMSWIFNRMCFHSGRVRAMTYVNGAIERLYVEVVARYAVEHRVYVVLTPPCAGLVCMRGAIRIRCGGANVG